MKTLTFLTLAAAAAITLPAHAVISIPVTISINAPGQYGRVNVDNYPQPRLVMPQPVIYAPSPVAIHQRPIYLYVPQTHQSNWGRYCGRYSACGQPVYFVQETWVYEEYRRENDKRKGLKKVKKYKNHDQKKGRGHDKHGD